MLVIGIFCLYWKINSSKLWTLYLNLFFILEASFLELAAAVPSHVVIFDAFLSSANVERCF